jgi:hypothetical protein
MVIVSFLLSFNSEHFSLKLLSFIGLFFYLAIVFLFRIKRVYIQPEEQNDYVIAPITGKVVSLNDNRIEIKKMFWQPSEIRNPQKSVLSSMEFSKQVKLFEPESSITGKLVGIAIGNVTCKIHIPKEQKIQIQAGDTIIAGVTVLAAASE